LQYVDKFTPRRRLQVDDDRDAGGLSDEELASELEAEVAHLRVVSNG
jgi:ribosome-binding protein aMBF1 (putative translation factor)